MYYLAVDGGTEGWALHEHEDLEAILKYITDGNIIGRFKIFRELKLEIIDE